METPENGGGQWRLQRLGEASGDSRDWGRPVETPENGGGQWRLQRLGETSGDSREWGRPVETPETGGDQWRLAILDTEGALEIGRDSRDRERLNLEYWRRLREDSRDWQRLYQYWRRL